MGLVDRTSQFQKKRQESHYYTGVEPCEENDVGSDISLCPECSDCGDDILLHNLSSDHGLLHRLHKTHEGRR